MIKKVLIFGAILSTIATAGVIYKNSQIENEIKTSLNQNSNMSYSDLKCAGVISTTCFVTDLNITENGNSTFIKKTTVENIINLDGIENKNGNFPLLFLIEDIQADSLISQYDSSKQISNFQDKTFNLKLVGNFDRNGTVEKLKIENLSIFNSLFDFSIGLDFKAENRKTILAKNLSVQFENMKLLKKVFEEKFTHLKTMDKFREYLISQINPTTNSILEKNLADALKSVIADNGKNILSISISTKNGEYIDGYKIFMGYSMLFMFQGVLGVEAELLKTFDIKIEAR